MNLKRTHTVPKQLLLNSQATETPIEKAGSSLMCPIYVLLKRPRQYFVFFRDPYSKKPPYKCVRVLVVVT